MRRRGAAAAGHAGVGVLAGGACGGTVYLGAVGTVGSGVTAPNNE